MSKKVKHKSLCFDCQNYMTCEKFVKSVMLPLCVVKFEAYNILENYPHNLSVSVLKCKNFLKDKSTL